MNKFEIRGQIVSYGTTKNNDWIEVSTSTGSITVYLEGISFSDLGDDFEDAYVIATGYLKSYKYTDDVAVVATNIEVK